MNFFSVYLFHSSYWLLIVDIPPVSELKWTTQNHQTCGELWLQMLKFYSLEFKNMDVVVSIRLSQKLTRDDKGWSGKRLAVEGKMI